MLRSTVVAAVFLICIMVPCYASPDLDSGSVVGVWVNEANTSEHFQLRSDAHFVLDEHGHHEGTWELHGNTLTLHFSRYMGGKLKYERGAFVDNENKRWIQSRLSPDIQTNSVNRAPDSRVLEGDLVAIGGTRGDIVITIQSRDGKYRIWPYYPPDASSDEMSKRTEAWKASISQADIGSRIQLDCKEIKGYDSALEAKIASCERVLIVKPSARPSSTDNKAIVSETPVDGNHVATFSAGTAQEAASKYIHGHLTHCNDSYYLEDYGGATPMGLREYRGLNWSVQQLPVSDADRLNGTTDRIRVTLSAAANRQHSPYGGTWTEWSPGFSIMSTDPANAFGISKGQHHFEMVRASGRWRIDSEAFELSKIQDCGTLLAIR